MKKAASKKTVKLRARVVFEWTYDADPENYGTNSPLMMASIDQENIEDDPFALLDGKDCTVTVRVAKEGDQG